MGMEGCYWVCSVIYLNNNQLTANWPMQQLSAKDTGLRGSLTRSSYDVNNIGDASENRITGYFEIDED
ncbi:hypothetical protein Cni_G16731 [Canna indica]|uniref:Uncharacterized protein n=1 Tax=Canna indica TaxID=4628 RepID=A0AAQ3QH31_9LILI|nr:hypothetical protein Cni_G16731 [Canna indica]